MRYIALMVGDGGSENGCGHTISCNKDFAIFDALNDTAALATCKERWESHGGSQGQPGISHITLFCAGAQIEVPLGQWETDEIALLQRKRDEAALAAAEKNAAALRAKLKK